MEMIEMKSRIVTGVVGGVLAFFLLVPVSRGQDLENTVFQIGNDIGVGARAMGMGGAYLAVGEDFSATFWNPAGIAQIRRMEFFGTMSHLKSKDEATFQTSMTPAEASYTRLGSMGFVLPIPTYRGSLVFAGGYNRVKDFDGSFEFSWIQNTPEGSVKQNWTELESGGLSNWVFSGAIDMSPNLSVGTSINFWTGRDDYETSFREDDDLDLYTFRYLQMDDNINTHYTGLNFKLGGLYRFGRNIRLGATMSTPVTFKAKENWSYDDVEEFDDGSQDSGSDSGVFEYKISSPFSFGVGAAISASYLTIAGDVEYRDWSQVRYKTEPPLSGLTKSEANREIQRIFRATTRMKVGGELTLPGLGTQLRAGYCLDPSPYKDAKSANDKKHVTFGLGLLLDKQIKFDVGWIRGWWQRSSGGLSEDVDKIDEDIQTDTILGTLAVRF
jgi:long-subunit fatty acid transport protein